ncbi:multiple sugar transport system permease protein [Labrys wisconsinensis]|uniref:Multiple sugar transport system permease protein n=2 Tax=Labrys wisconsinensis TaxID=425677 RepID=A0ABU0J939_9HYPH|nr:multiple sugar transport system permease protein [Labrys wisconsinensis]
MPVRDMTLRRLSGGDLRLGMPAPWLLLLPLLIVIAGIVGYPFVQTIVLSFTNARLLTGFAASHWVGFENYQFALTDVEFLQALLRTLYFTGMSVGFEAILGVLVALLLNQEFRGRTLCRALLVLPWAVPTIVNALMWRLIYQPDFGGLNAALVQTGLMDAYRSWLGDGASAMNAIVFADVWKNYPLVALIVLAALQNAPKDLYEAARIDGANAWQRFRVVTWPVISAPLVIALVLRCIEALKVFDIVYVMTRGGPANATKTVSFFVYQESFGFNRVGSGASYALIVVLIATVFVAAYVRLLRRTEAGA